MTRPTLDRLLSEHKSASADHRFALWAQLVLQSAARAQADNGTIQRATAPARGETSPPEIVRQAAEREPISASCSIALSVRPDGADGVHAELCPALSSRRMP